MRIWARSKNPEKWKIYEWVTKHNANANDDIYACVTLHNTNVNDIIHDCVAPHDAHTCNHILWESWAFSRVGCCVFIFTQHAPWLKFESFISSPWPSMCVRSLHFDPPFLLLALPSAPFPLPQLHEVCGKPAQLLQRECGRLWRAPPLHIFLEMKTIHVWTLKIRILSEAWEAGADWDKCSNPC